MEALWRIELLGGLRAVHRDQCLSRFTTQKFAALLAYLAFYPERAHGRDELAALLWPESAPAAGRRHLRVALTSLRHQLEPPSVPPGAVFLGTRTTLQLNPAACVTDVAQFEAACRQAARLAGSSRGERAQRLAAAVEAYGGALLPGCCDEWIMPERQRLAERFLQVLSELVVLLEQGGDMGGALAYARRAVAVDPLGEEARHELIRLLAAAGQPEAALREYLELERLLDREYGEAPAPDTQALATAIRPSGSKIARRDRPLTAPVPDPGPCPSSPLLTGTVTFLLVDLEGSAAIEAVRARLRPLFHEHRGHELQGGGCTLPALFGRASDALAAAAACLRAQISSGGHGDPGPNDPAAVAAADLQNLSPENPFTRMALHTGEIGPGEPLACSPALRQAWQLLRAAHPGQILVSEKGAVLLQDHLLPGMRLVDLGRHRLPHATAPLRLFQLEDTALALGPFPPPRAIPDAQGRVPLTFNRFFGREAEIEQLVRVVGCQPSTVGEVKPVLTDGRQPTADGPRLVTLIGPGGIGKTRLALELARRLQETGREGAAPRCSGPWFVPLADVRDASQIPGKLLEVVRLPQSLQIEPLEQVVDFLSREPTLLLLDNFEHLLAEGAPLVRTLLERAPCLTVVVTSRQCLGLEGEREFPVAPLPVPVESGKLRVESPTEAALSALSTLNSQLSTLVACPSVRLFLDRAQAARPDFQITAANAAVVGSLCQKLEGIPLAIELAAARAWALTPAQVLARLEERFELLVSRRRDIPARQRSLRATLDWSYQLLPAAVQRFFARLSVFRGGWTLEAAAAVCTFGSPAKAGTAEPSDNLDLVGPIQNPKSKIQNTLDCLEQLRECSLVLAEEGAVGRFRMLETLREYAARRLEPEERAAAARCHAQYYLTFAEYRSAVSVEAWLERMETERENLRAALDECQSEGDESGSLREIGFRIARALLKYWHTRGCLNEGRQRLTALLALPTTAIPASVCARALIDAGYLGAMLGDSAAARPLLEEGLALFRELGDREGIAQSLSNLALVVAEDAAKAALYEESLEIRRALGDQGGIANLCFNLSIVAQSQGDLGRAEALAAESLAGYRTLGRQCATDGIAMATSQLGCLAQESGDFATARRRFEEGLSLFRELQNKPRMVEILLCLGNQARIEGDLACARMLLTEAASLSREMENRGRVAGCLKDLAEVALQTGDHDAAQSLLEEALALYREEHFTSGSVACREGLARVALVHGDAAGARKQYEMLLILARETGDWSGVGRSLDGLARMTTAVLNPSPVAQGPARWLGAAATLAKQLSDAFPGPLERWEHSRLREALRAALGEAAFAAAWAAGQSMAPELALEEALRAAAPLRTHRPGAALGRGTGTRPQSRSALGRSPAEGEFP